MTSKRIFTWVGFVVIVGLIIWGLIAAEMKSNKEQELLPLPEQIVATDHIKGSETAPVTLVEYGDFQCPACQTYHAMVEQLLSELGSSTVRFVFRHFPLAQHANAMISSLAAEAAGSQGKFWEMYDILYKEQREWEGVKDPTSIFVKYAQSLNLDLEKFKTDLTSEQAKERINNDYKGGVKAGIVGTPTFFVNGKQIKNPQSLNEFKDLINKASTEGVNP